MMNVERMSRDQLIEHVYTLEAKVSEGGQGEREVLELRRALGLSENEARIVARLSDGRPHLTDSIISAVYPDGDEPETRCLEVFICRARKKLAKIGVKIKNVRGTGYYLEPADALRAEVSA